MTTEAFNLKKKKQKKKQKKQKNKTQTCEKKTHNSVRLIVYVQSYRHK